MVFAYSSPSIEVARLRPVVRQKREKPILIGFLVIGLLALWNLFRVIRGLVYALDGKPIADPAGWL